MTGIKKDEIYANTAAAPAFKNPKPIQIIKKKIKGNILLIRFLLKLDNTIEQNNDANQHKYKTFERSLVILLYRANHGAKENSIIETQKKILRNNFAQPSEKKLKSFNSLVVI